MVKMSIRLSAQERKDLDKFTKFLALKAAQVIVQSRLGEKVTTNCKPGSDWFNLAIQDLPDVLAETKKALNGEVLVGRLPLCIEISLRTADGDPMVLESWCLGILPEQCCDPIRVTHTIYNRMGILLKSLVSVTRVTPAYKLSRRQGPDSYIICYRVYMDEPQLHTLGEGYKQVRIGQLCTPIGTLHLTVFYRTKMTISPTSSGKDNSIMLKSDHFNTNLCPKHMRYKQDEENSDSLRDTMKVGAFAECKKTDIEPELIIPNVPFSTLLSERIQEAEQDTEEVVANTNKTIIVAEGDRNGNDNRTNTTPSESQTSLTMMSTNDDFIMVDLKTPFANKSTNSELRMFYQEWQSAPPLQTFTDVPSLAEQVQELSKQLKTFESDMYKFDDMMQSLCQSTNDN